MIPKGTILMAMYGQGKTRGQVAILELDATINQACAAIQLNADANRDYVFQQLRYRYNSIRALSNTGSQENLNADLIREIAFPLPSLHEQELAAEILNTWDTAIEKTERLVAAKKQKSDALANQLLFGKRRLGQHHAPATQSLHWFSMPSDWHIVEIGQIAREVSATNSGGEDLPVLSCTKYDGLVDSLKYFDKQVFSHDTSKYKVVRHGQFAYATNHIEEGSIGYQDLMPDGLVSPIYTVFQADPAQIDDGYLYKLLKTEKLRQLFAANTNASVDRRGSLRWKEFSRIHIPLPPLDEQQQISTVLDEAKQEINLLKAKAEALKAQKRGLMQKLLTGQWRLKPSDMEAPAP
jgi:type I restriction enzyme S subunit